MPISRNEKSDHEGRFFTVQSTVFNRNERLFLLYLLLERFVSTSEFLLELLYAAHGVDELLLPGIERVRGTGNVNVVDGVFFTVFPLDGFLGVDCRLGQDRKVGLFVLKHNWTIVWVDVRFHLYSL